MNIVNIKNFQNILNNNIKYNKIIKRERKIDFTKKYIDYTNDIELREKVINCICNVYEKRKQDKTL